MALIRIWILRIAATAAITIAIFLFYDASENFSWGRRALAESGYRPSVMGEIAATAAQKNQEGRADANTAALLVTASLMMEALAATLKRLEQNR